MSSGSLGNHGLSSSADLGPVELLGRASEPVPLSAGASNEQQVLQTHRDSSSLWPGRTPACVSARVFMCITKKKAPKESKPSASHPSSHIWFTVSYCVCGRAIKAPKRSNPNLGKPDPTDKINKMELKIDMTHCGYFLRQEPLWGPHVGRRIPPIDVGRRSQKMERQHLQHAQRRNARGKTEGMLRSHWDQAGGTQERWR